MTRDHETAIHRGRRLRDRAARQRELVDATLRLVDVLATGDELRTARARWALERRLRGHLVRVDGR